MVAAAAYSSLIVYAALGSIQQRLAVGRKELKKYFKLKPLIQDHEISPPCKTGSQVWKMGYN
jgi:hypothetical protein